MTTQPVGFTLTPTGPVRFTISRLRKSVADANLISDADLLQIINDGYVTLVEKSRYQKAATPFPLTAGQREYGLPVNCCEVFRVYKDGIELTPVPLEDADTDLSGDFYYQYENLLGLIDTPEGAGEAWIFYATRPTPLLIDDVPQIPPEFYYLLRHYAAWRCYLLQSGAQRLKQAAAQKALFDEGIHLLRSVQTIEAAPRRLSSLVTGPPPSGVR